MEENIAIIMCHTTSPSLTLKAKDFVEKILRPLFSVETFIL